MFLTNSSLEYGFYPVSGNVLRTAPQDIHFLNFSDKYDYIIYTVPDSEKMSTDLYTKHLALLRTMLAESGKLLVCVPNRFGAKYLCGEPYGSEQIPFDGICGETGHLGREEVLNILNSVGFKYVKLYYPFPNADSPDIVYTDKYLPGKELCEKLYVNVTNRGARVLEEKEFLVAAASNKFAHLTVNSFIAECSDAPCEGIIYSCITSNRRKERAFVTSIYNDGTVRKVPIYDEGITGLEQLRQNTAEMASNGIPALPVEIENNIAVMKRVPAHTLSDLLRECTKKDKDKLLKYTDRLYEYILKSSEHISSENNEFINMAPPADWGVILKKAYIEMIPVNCFIENGEFLFFDQEYSISNCPARYVMSRAVADIYSFIPEVANIISEDEMKKRYGLYELWQCFRNIESRFFDKEVFSDTRHICISDDVAAIRKNRRMLKMHNEINERIYNPIEGLGERKIILFGSGKYADYYLDKYGDAYPPEFIVDNNPEKQGTYKRGIEIKSPNELNKLIYGTYRVVITVARFEDIVNQLESMGINCHNYRIFNRYIEQYLPYSITDTMSDGKYNIGYVTGAFDLFHIGHLNILRRSKERCHYLIAGVLTDEIIIEEKKKTPFVPFEERIEIVKQCRYVDRVIPVDKHNTDKLDAFKELRYSCFFSGNDHNWQELKRCLVSLGSNVELFEYTKSTSSTMLQKAIEDSIKAK